ncbi:MAG: class I SAM-dependent methyltransferase [Acidimicrobiia bacterium]
MSDPDPTRAVLETWDGVAPAWERNRQWVFEGFRPVSEWLVDRVDPQPGQTVLELAAGPGETGFLAAERVGPSGRLISSDLAPTMVEAARRGAEERGLGNVECRVIDAQQMDLPDASVDGVISRLGFMLVPDPARALGETRRVLRPGGKLAYAVIGPPDRNPWMGLMMGAIVQSGHPPPGDPFAPGGPFSLSAPERNRELAAGADYSDVEVDEIAGAMHFADADDYFALVGALAGPVTALLASFSADEVDAIRASLAPMLAPFRSGDGYDVPTLVLGVTAT